MTKISEQEIMHILRSGAIKICNILIFKICGEKGRRDWSSNYYFFFLWLEGFFLFYFYFPFNLRIAEKWIRTIKKMLKCRHRVANCHRSHVVVMTIRLYRILCIGSILYCFIIIYANTDIINIVCRVYINI